MTPPGGALLYRGPAYASFERPLPEVVEATLLRDFEEYFNQTQVRREGRVYGGRSTGRLRFGGRARKGETGAMCSAAARTWLWSCQA